jgi:hypothetical protein
MINGVPRESTSASVTFSCYMDIDLGVVARRMSAQKSLALAMQVASAQLSSYMSR